jgi:H+/Cl- antiporter ClcA
MSSSVIINSKYMITFFFSWYILMAITYGVFVPAGLFLPGMIIGCAIGHIYGYSLATWGIITPEDYELNKKNFIIIAIAGYMSGYTRLTYSLCLILMETS